MATDDLDDTRVLNALGRLLAAGEPFTALPLVDPATKLFPDATMDVLDGRYPAAAEVSDLEASVTTQAETLTAHGADIDGLTTDVGALETLTASGRLSTSQLSNTIGGTVSAGIADTSTVIGAAAASTFARALPECRGYQNLATQLRAGTGGSALLLGDSTANDPTEWYYLFAQSLAALYPAVTFEHRLVNDTTDKYAPPAVIQTGTAGAHSVTMGATGVGSGVYVDASVFSSSDFDIAVKVKHSAFSTDATRTVLAQMGAAGERGFSLFLMGASNGYRPRFTPYSDGTNVSAGGSFTASATPSYVDGSYVWIRFTLDADNGSGGADGKFYTGVETATGITWTQLGTTLTQAAPVTVFRPDTVVYNIGSANGGSVFSGAEYKEVHIRSGIDGPIVANPVVRQWTHNANVTVTGAPVFTFWNGSMAGRNIAWFSDAARFPKLLPLDASVGTIFISDGHNESRREGQRWVQDYTTFLAAVAARHPQAQLVLMVQNPETAPATAMGAHNTRMSQLEALGNASRHGVINVYRAFLNSGVAIGTLVNPADGIHPLPAGSARWRDAALAPLALLLSA